jgi:hypothetical protein
MKADSATLFNAERNVGRALVALSRAEGHTDLSKIAEYQHAMEEAHRLIGIAVDLLHPVTPMLHSMALTQAALEKQEAEASA